MLIKQTLIWHALLIVFCMSLICGCGSPYKSVDLDPLKLFQEKNLNAVNSSKPSQQTQQTLRLMFLDGMYRKNPEQVIATLEQQVKEHPSHEVRLAIAELALLQAQGMQKSNSHKTKVYYFIAAKNAYNALFFDTLPDDSNFGGAAV